MLDDLTDWTARPYSALKGGLPPLFTSLESNLFLVTEMPFGLRKNFFLLLVLFLLIFKLVFKMSMRLKPITPIGLLANLVVAKASWDISLP